MENSIHGEVYCSSLEMIKIAIESNFDVSIREKNNEDIFIQNDYCTLNIYDNTSSFKDNYLIGGNYNGTFSEAATFVTKLSELFLSKNWPFELEVRSDENLFTIKNEQLA